jgi:hypothetical protein
MWGRNDGKERVVVTCLDGYETFQRLVVLPTLVPEAFGLWIFLLVHSN